jgi:hypothetical protein
VRACVRAALFHPSVACASGFEPTDDCVGAGLMKADPSALPSSAAATTSTNAASATTAAAAAAAAVASIAYRDQRLHIREVSGALLRLANDPFTIHVAAAPAAIGHASSSPPSHPPSTAPRVPIRHRHAYWPRIDDVLYGSQQPVLCHCRRPAGRLLLHSAADAPAVRRCPTDGLSASCLMAAGRRNGDRDGVAYGHRPTDHLHSSHDPGGPSISRCGLSFGHRIYTSPPVPARSLQSRLTV